MLVRSEREAREVIESCKMIGIEPISIIVWTEEADKSRGHMNRETYDLKSLRNWEPSPNYPNIDPINKNLLDAIHEGLSSLK